jgi:hypothetical protein
MDPLARRESGYNGAKTVALWTRGGRQNVGQNFVHKIF